MNDHSTFEQAYPTLSRWVQHHGWLEVDRTDWSRSLIRAFDDGGLVWEGAATAPAISAALAEAETALAAWLREQFGDRP